MILQTHVATEEPNLYNLSEPVRQRGYDGRRYSEPKAKLKQPTRCGRFEHGATAARSGQRRTPCVRCSTIAAGMYTPTRLSTCPHGPSSGASPGASWTDPMSRLLEVLADKRGRTIEAPHLPKPPAAERLLLPRFDDGCLGSPSPVSSRTTVAPGARRSASSGNAG